MDSKSEKYVDYFIDCALKDFYSFAVEKNRIYSSMMARLNEIDDIKDKKEVKTKYQLILTFLNGKRDTTNKFTVNEIDNMRKLIVDRFNSKMVEFN
jgi:hypothetical protein